MRPMRKRTSRHWLVVAMLGRRCEARRASGMASLPPPGCATRNGTSGNLTGASARADGKQRLQHRPTGRTQRRGRKEHDFSQEDRGRNIHGISNLGDRCETSVSDAKSGVVGASWPSWGKKREVRVQGWHARGSRGRGRGSGRRTHASNIFNH